MIREKLLEIHKVKRASTLFLKFNDSQSIKELVEIVKNQEKYPLEELSSWALTHLIKTEKAEIQKYYYEIVDTLFLSKNQSVLRNCMSILYQLEIINYRDGELLDLILNFIKDNNNKVALQVYSIYSLIQFVKKYPELLPEIKSVIEYKEMVSPSIKVAKNKFYNAIKKP